MNIFGLQEITEGSLCTAQAVLKQIGIVGVAMTSLAIAVHTFSILVLRWKAPRHISKYVVLGVWIFTALVIGIPNAIHRNEKYYGPTGYWCWIVPEFKTEQIVTEYLWVWIAGFSMAILYTIMFLVIRGWFIIDNGIHWHKTYEPVQEGAWEPETEEDKETKLIANSMLFYPAVYIFCVFPNSLARWLYFSKFDIPYQFTLFASTLYALSGMLNLILFFITRRDVVVGPNVTVEAPNTTHRRNDSTGHAPQKLGRLPDRTYNDVKQDIEMQGQPNANARLLESHHLIYHSPPPLSAQLSAHPNTLNHLSADHEDAYSRKHSRASSSVTEDQEDYGHLPG
ncbi:hypothetical protein B0H34DRAFT_189084 [Crassisporium funariophilum]|nr:hypothetical protein B0H34DRAFT_189084 [Crassisporium funariophilum]